MPSGNVSRFDSIYRSLLLTRFFTKGWGKPEHLKQIFALRRKLASRKTALQYIHPQPYPVTISKDEHHSTHRILEGHFISPAVKYLPQLLPEESVKAHFQVVLPNNWTDSHDKLRPMVLQYAGTGDHYYWRRRRLMALPMVKERGIGSIILECPFYGLRKPKHQLRSSLQNVSDLFVMGACLILESLVMFQWCEQEGFGPLAAHGISMGGHMASLGASAWPKPIALIPCLSWTSGSVTFTKGVMTGAIPWDVLCKQYQQNNAYKDEILHMVKCEENAFQAGKEFAQSLDNIAAINAEKENHTTRNRIDNITSENMQLFDISQSTANASLQQEHLKNDQRELSMDKLSLEENKNHVNNVMTSEITDEKLKNLENDCLVREPSSSYTNILESLHLPFLSSTKTLDEGVGTGKKNNRSNSSSSEEGSSTDWQYMLPNIIRNDSTTTKDSLHREAVQFMRGIMDEATHLKNYDVPYDPSLIIMVAAELDAYQPREGITALPDIWPGSEIRYIKHAGHVSSYLFKQDVFRQAIYDAIDKMSEKYPSKLSL